MNKVKYTEKQVEEIVNRNEQKVSDHIEQLNRDNENQNYVVYLDLETEEIFEAAINDDVVFTQEHLQQRINEGQAILVAQIGSDEIDWNIDYLEVEIEG